MRNIVKTATLIVLTVVLIAFVACNTPDVTATQKYDFSKLQPSPFSEFDFGTDSGGWQTVAAGQYDSAQRIDFGKTGVPCIQLCGADLDVADVSVNAAMYNMFQLKQTDKFLVLNVNVIDGLQTLLRVQVTETDEQNGKSLCVTNTALQQDANGFYKLTSISDTVLAFDLSEYAGKTIGIAIENESISANGKEGVQINSVKITDNFSTISSLTSWSARQIASDWQLKGSAQVVGDNIVLADNGYGSLISNTVHVNTNTRFLRILLKANSNVQPRVIVIINNNVITNQDGVLFATGNTSDYVEYVYDLSEYVDRVSTLQISNESDGEAAIKSVVLNSTAPGATKLQVWTASDIYYNWAKQGNVALHKEGVCLEYGEETFIYTNVSVTEDNAYLVISFRKFIRETEQDKDPKIVVYVNDQLLTAIGQKEFVTATTNDYSQYTFSLAQFKGQNVTVKIATEEGEHACFDCVCVYQLTK
ncbi:MAG: hypothetical protein ACI4QL_04290 [Candidatus Fimimonas sp.]